MFCTIIVKIIYNIFVLKICRSLIINENLEVGTQIAYIKKALELGYSVLVLNTNNNYEGVEGMQFLGWSAPLPSYCRSPIIWLYCYKLIQRFRVTGLFGGQYNTKLHGTITDVINTIVGSALLRD